MRVVCHVLVLCVVVVGCKVRRPGADSTQTSVKSDPVSAGASVADPGYDEGFILSIPQISAESCSTEDGAPPSGAQIHTVAGDLWAEGPSGLALDRQTVEGSLVFQWPARSEVIDRDYGRLQRLWTEFRALVGQCRHREVVGAGEIAWVNGLRMERVKKVEETLESFDPEMTRWCGAVVKNFLESYVPRGSTYRQYANAIEGSAIGACLSLRAGIKPTDIYLCYSRNEHVFTLAKDYRSELGWSGCILDAQRDLPGFTCNRFHDANLQQVQEWLPAADQPGRFRLSHVDVPHYNRSKCMNLYDYSADPKRLYE